MDVQADALKRKEPRLRKGRALKLEDLLRDRGRAALAAAGGGFGQSAGRQGNP